jgi:hypothetical protein
MTLLLYWQGTSKKGGTGGPTEAAVNATGMEDYVGVLVVDESSRSYRCTVMWIMEASVGTTVGDCCPSAPRHCEAGTWPLVNEHRGGVIVRQTETPVGYADDLRDAKEDVVLMQRGTISEEISHARAWVNQNVNAIIYITHLVL